MGENTSTGNINTNNQYSKNHNVLIVVYAFLIMGLFYFPNLFIVLILKTIIGIVTMVSPVVGLSFYLISSVTDLVLESRLSLDMSLVTVASYLSFLFGIISNFLVNKRYVKTNEMHVKFVLIFGVWVCISMLINFKIEDLSSYIILFMNLGVCLTVAWVVGEKEMATGMTFNSIFVAAIILMVFGFVTGEHNWRLSIFRNVRSIANVVGLTLVVYAGCYLNKMNQDVGKLLFLTRYKILNIISLGMLFIGLVFGLSRGMILTVVLSVMNMFLFGLLWKKQMEIKKGKTVIFISLIVLLVGISIKFFLDNPVYLNYISKNPFENVRFKIWMAAISNIEGVNWIIGSGIGQFKNLANLGGLNFYAHSIYVDTLASLGLIGVFIMFYYLLHLGFGLFKTKNILGLGVYTYLIMAFSTHGHINTSLFWIALGFVMGFYLRRTNYKEIKSRNNKKRLINCSLEIKNDSV